MLCQVSEQSNEFRHGQWTYDENLFSKISQIIGRFGQRGRINSGVFGVLPFKLSAHILSLCVPSPLGCKELGI
jgi:hypothetical protein